MDQFQHEVAEGFNIMQNPDLNEKMNLKRYTCCTAPDS